MELNSDLLVLPKYASFFREFEQLLEHAILLLNKQSGSKVNSSRENYGEKIFGKIVCHSISLKRLLPNPNVDKDTDIWDISSVYAISRTIIESYEALAYITSENISEEELECRILTWKLHAEERLHKMLTLIGSNDSKVLKVKKYVKNLRIDLLSQRFKSIVPNEVRKKIEKGNCPPYLISRKLRLKSANINSNYFDAVLMNLSSHVHSHPFSLHQLFDFRAGTDEAYMLMKIAGEYACGFLSVAIRDMTSLFSPRVPEISNDVKHTVELWCELLKQGVILESNES